MHVHVATFIALRKTTPKLRAVNGLVLSYLILLSLWYIVFIGENDIQIPSK